MALRYISYEYKEECFGIPLFLLRGGVSFQIKNILKYSHQSRKELFVDWNAIKAEYIAGGTSYRKLAEKYGVSFTTLTRTAQRENWVGLRQQSEDKVTTNIVNQVTNTKTKNAIKLETVADKALEKIYELLEVANDTQSLKQITSALRDIKEVKGIKSAADMKEQNARIAKLQAEVNRDDDTVKEIKVVFNAGEEAWNE